MYVLNITHINLTYTEKNMNISYDHYRIFYYVAKYRSITQAATILLSNQPNVTRTIKNLEKELDCVLFVRSRQGVQLTPEGEKLFEHIRIAFEHIEAGEEEIALKKTMQRGIITIGASELALHCLLLPILKEYRQLYPGVRIRVSNYSTPQALNALKNGLVDISVVTTPLDLSDSMKSTPIKSIQEVAICGSAFSFLVENQLTLSELAEYPLICLGESTKTYEFYSTFFKDNRVAFLPSVEAATADQIMPLVMHDLGIGFVPVNFLENIKDSSSVHMLHLEETIPPRNICLVKRKGTSLSIAAKKLEEMILDTKTIE